MALAPALALGLTALASPHAAAAGQTPDGVEFFESRIRPVLVEHCVKCHSADTKTRKGSLRLDDAEAFRKGGASGPAFVPGKPDESLIIEALRHGNDALQMPPKRKLPEPTIADFEAWIRMGAPTSRAPSEGVKTGRAERTHWAFQPIAPGPLPTVKASAWPRTSVDHFILAKLEAHGLAPSPPADKRTLLRRVYLDLIGLPPTAEEIDDFVDDNAPDAYARVVDRLLASPQYGERWGRHWLDVARYADTKDGVLMYGDDRVRPYAYTYRDYVIRALNEDTPFDQFVIEQLAADQVAPKVEPWRLAAMGFLTLGRMFDMNIHDILDDRIDTVTRGFLGLTVSCARCHDHKYDPIPTADYYSLYGVFASSEAPIELPLIHDRWTAPGAESFEAQAGPKRAALRKFVDDQYAMLLEDARTRVGDYLVHAATTEPDPLETAIFFFSLAPEQLRPQIVARWRRLISQNARADDPVFGPWHDLMALDDQTFANRAGPIVAKWRANPTGTERGQLNPLVLSALKKRALTSRAEVARMYGDLLRAVYEKSKTSAVSASSEPAARAQLLALVVGPSSPPQFPKSHTRDYMSRAEKDSFGGRLIELDRMAVQAAAAPPRAMVLYDSEQLCDPRVFVRGNPARPGERVPRQFLKVVSGGSRAPFAHGSGRLDLARAITAPGNPLTSRVIANRVWMHHLGDPLAETPNDLGTRCSEPVHLRLLDHLAAELQARGWSLKALHRLIVLSNTYQQASLDRPDARRVDPDNRFVWRMNRRRLDLESMRDSLLAVSGRLDHTFGGRPVDIVGNPKNGRRTVYGLVDRQNVPGFYRAFDFASPDQSAERRPRTMVPQQALFGMNSAFVIEQAKALAANPTVMAESDPAHRVAAVYRLVLGRHPSGEETQLALTFLSAAETGRAQAPGSQLDPWQQFAQVLVITNELIFVD
jgi:mono/diheme cytochrome c family protein